jgi:hypothetical protein
VVGGGIFREEDLERSPEAKDLELPPKPAFLAADAIHDGTDVAELALKAHEELASIGALPELGFIEGFGASSLQAFVANQPNNSSSCLSVFIRVPGVILSLNEVVRSFRDSSKHQQEGEVEIPNTIGVLRNPILEERDILAPSGSGLIDEIIGSDVDRDGRMQARDELVQDAALGRGASMLTITISISISISKSISISITSWWWNKDIIIVDSIPDAPSRRALVTCIALGVEEEIHIGHILLIPFIISCPRIVATLPSESLRIEGSIDCGLRLSFLADEIVEGPQFPARR